jgi:hypothetical protein
MVSRLGLALGAGASRLILLEKISQHRGSLDAIFQAYLFDAHIDRFPKAIHGHII